VFDSCPSHFQLFEPYGYILDLELVPLVPFSLQSSNFYASQFGDVGIANEKICLFVGLANLVRYHPFRMLVLLMV